MKPISRLNQSRIGKNEYSDGAETPYKSADIYAGIQLSPDGNYVMISTIKKPFSYIVPLSKFPMTAQVFDLQGNLVKTVNDVPLNEIMPKGFSSVRTGKEIMSLESR